MFSTCLRRIQRNQTFYYDLSYPVIQTNIEACHLRLLGLSLNIEEEKAVGRKALGRWSLKRRSLQVTSGS